MKDKRKPTRADINKRLIESTYYGWARESEIPDGYIWPDRVPRGESVLIWKPILHGIWDKGHLEVEKNRGWEEVIARDGYSYWKDTTYCPPIGDISYTNPYTNKLDCITAIRRKQEYKINELTGEKDWVDIGLHDPNPHVLVKYKGEREIAEDENGRPYYPFPNDTV
jgi:hypothetical protein